MLVLFSPLHHRLRCIVYYRGIRIENGGLSGPIVLVVDGLDSLCGYERNAITLKGGICCSNELRDKLHKRLGLVHGRDYAPANAPLCTAEMCYARLCPQQNASYANALLSLGKKKITSAATDKEQKG
jgi:hypothetical protein